MNTVNYQVRRATLEDVGALMGLWASMQFAGDELARRITEFQVVQDDAGQLLGALGLQIVEKQGRIHSEGFTDFALAEQLRPQLWERIQSVAANHGLVRLWTDEQAPFWSRCGLQPAEAETLQKLPGPWRDGTGKWLTLKLKEELQELISADQAFALFMQSEKAKSRKAIAQAKALKLIATLVAFALLVLVVVGALYLFRHSPRLGR